MDKSLETWQWLEYWRNQFWSFLFCWWSNSISYCILQRARFWFTWRFTKRQTKGIWQCITGKSMTYCWFITFVNYELSLNNWIFLPGKHSMLGSPNIVLDHVLTMLVCFFLSFYVACNFQRQTTKFMCIHGMSTLNWVSLVEASDFCYLTNMFEQIHSFCQHFSLPT